MLFALALASCGGSSGGGGGGGNPPPPVDTDITVGGTVQKGLFNILNVRAYPVDETNGDLGAWEPVPVTDQTFSIDLAQDQLTLFDATGTFTSEITGEAIEADKPLRLIVAAGQTDVDANINIATTLVAELVLQELRAGGVADVAALIAEKNEFINSVLGFPPGTDPSQLDFNDITDGSDMSDPNLQLLILSGGIVEILSSDQLFAGGFEALLDGILAAQTVNEAIAVLDPLQGLSANAIFALAQQYSGFDLPMLTWGGNFYVYVCNLDNQCSWQEVTEPLISVSGTSAWEADRKARVFVRTNEVTTTSMDIIVEVSSDTATVGEDVIGFRRTVTLPGGRSSVAVDIDLIVDGLAEGTEKFQVSIEPGAFAYPVFQDTAGVTLYDGVKPTYYTTDNRDPTGLDLSFAVTEVCNPVHNLGDADCVVFDGTESVLNLVAGRANLAHTNVDVIGDCTALGICQVDWIVDFFLVAKANGTSVSEVPLGSILYPWENVEPPSDPREAREPYVRLTDPATIALSQEAAANGWDLELEARIGETNTIAAAEALPPFVEAPDSVLVGDTLFEVGVVYDVMPGADYGCPTSQYAINAQYAQQGAAGPFTSGTLCVDFDVGGAGAGPATLVEGQLDVAGGTAVLANEVSFDLPAGLYAEIEEADVSGGSETITEPRLRFIPTSGFVAVTNRLHHLGWPFLFVIDRLSLTPDGVELGYGDMQYVQNVGYSSQDPRSLGILFSNDIFYRGVAGHSGTLGLDGTGVAGDITVSGGPFQADHTAFPRARVEWQDFTQSIVGNDLQATTVTVDEYRLGQSTACTEPGCAQGQKDWFSVSGTVALDGRGYVLGDTVNVGAQQVPRWGILDNGDYAWSRPDDLSVQSSLKLAVPGYVVPAETVSDVLLAHLDDPAPGVIEIHPRGTDAAADGNYHPTGLSIGPEIYRDGAGQPQTGDGQDLGGLGTALRLDNGVDPAVDLVSSPGVKYVIRNAGITGVFNIQPASLLGTAPQFYGYDIELSRFAVRAVDNALDTETWIDGRLALNGDAGGPDGLDLFFENLDIDCGARLGDVNLMYEACDGQDNNGNGFDDENCSPVLHAWTAETDILAAGFTGNDGGQSCAATPQQFGLEHQIHFAALDKPVAFRTEWDTGGFLSSQESGQLSTYRFDRSEQGQGFPLKTSSGVETDVRLGAAQVDGTAYGWLEMRDSKVGVPFWDALETDLRVANARRFGEIAPEPTVVIKKGELGNQALNTVQRNKDLLRQANDYSAQPSNDAAEIKANYSWGNTGFGFRLPVYYQPWQLDTGRSDADARGRQSRFLGRQLTKDLFVLDANAGINFIEPDRTKLSFGASADFTRLEGLEFQLDITDVDSAAAVDSVLQDLGITRGPLLEPAIRDLLETLDIVNTIANRGMEELLQKALEEAVEEIGKATAPLTPNNQDPFVTASEMLTQLQSMPQQINALIENDVRGPLNNRLTALKDDLRQALIELEAAILSVNDADSPAERIAKFEIIDEATEKARRLLGQVETELRKIDIQLTAMFNLGQDVLIQGIMGVTEISAALENVNLVMRQAASVVDSACTDGLLISEEGNGFLTVAAQRIAAVRKVADIIRNTNDWLAAAETIARNEDVKQQLATARQRIRDATAELIVFVDNADRAVSGLLCPTDAGQQADLLVENAEQVTNRILGQLGGLNAALIDAVAGLQQAVAVKEEFTARIYEPIRAARNALEPVQDPDRTGNGDRLNRIVSCILYNASHSVDIREFCDYTMGLGSVPAAQGDYGINALANNGPGERDIADALFFFIETEVNSALDGAQGAIADATQALVPGAYMSPEQLRRMLVQEIMRSAPVKDLRREMDKHFAEIAYAVNNIGLQVVDQINFVIEDALSAVTGPINDALREATAGVRGIPLQSAGINGFATIAGNELERAHLSASWTMRGGDDDDSTGFKAALDAESWSAKHTNPDVNTPTACILDAEESLLDVKISAYGLPINVMAADIEIEKLYLGFTLRNGQPGGPALVPIGIFGGINTIGEIGFSDAVVFDPAFAAGLGAKQTYIGASAGAVFSSLTADVAFLVGRVCPGNSVITDLDPDVEKFLPNLPASGFTGAYLRGGATIPIIPGGCALNVGVVADFGTWIFVGRPTTFGGLVGGGATGQVLCIAALKGKVTVGGSASTDGDIKLTGEGWGVAGVGLDCNPGTWTSVARSREDSWCGTGDAQFDASFDNGKWDVNPPKPSAIH